MVQMDVYYERQGVPGRAAEGVGEAASAKPSGCWRCRRKKSTLSPFICQDVTELNRYIQENEEQRLVAGLIYIDNYDEVIRQCGGGAPVSSGGAGGPEDQSVYRAGRTAL